MLFWTHLLGGIFGGLLFLHLAENKLAFFFVCLIASLFPDIDSYNSKLGKNSFSRTLTAFTKHRGFIHSFLFMALIYFVIDKIWPTVSLAFLIGYSIHLLLDSLTYRGVRLFWPFKFRIKFRAKSGGLFESVLFIILLILDSVLFAMRIL